MIEAPNTSSAADFDFLVGKWRIKHHRLDGRLTGATTWTTADATHEMRKILLGTGNFDQMNRTLDGLPYEGSSIRIFDPQTRMWSIYWVDTVTRRVEPPVHGYFENGVGVFLGDDELRGEAIRVRFIWSDITENTARWEQAFSNDGELTWEVNSIMEFTRTH